MSKLPSWLRPKTKLNKRLMPLYVATFAQWLCLWVATEKLFMTEIGFDAASIGLLAAIYAVLVPFVEIPSGVWADRWSRKGVLIIASLALVVSALIGGLSFGVPLYIVSALLLGIFFALVSGTFEAIVYDTVMEETGDSKAFEKSIGRVKLYSSLGGLIAALLGGVLAAATNPRMTYFVTVPLVATSIFALLKFREPQLHKKEAATSFMEHVATTYRVILKTGKLLPIIALLVLAAMLVQVLLEFGQLWLVTLKTPTLFYGVAFAALLAAIGFGGVLAGRIKFHQVGSLTAVIAGMILSCITMIFVQNAFIVTAAQVALATLIIVVSILFTRLMHDTIPSNVRSGVTSGVSAFAWMIFVPFSLLFGWVSKEYSVFKGGWLILALTAVACIILASVSLGKEFKEARHNELAPENK